MYVYVLTSIFAVWEIRSPQNHILGKPWMNDHTMWNEIGHSGDNDQAIYLFNGILDLWKQRFAAAS